MMKNFLSNCSVDLTIGFLLFWLSFLVAADECFNENKELKEGCKIQTVIATVLELDKSKYKSDDDFRIKVTIKNISSTDIFIYSKIELMEGPNLSIWMSDMSGNDVGMNSIATSNAPLPTSASDFMNLPAKNSTVIDFKMNVSDFLVVKGGKYKVISEFHSPVPSNFNFGLPILSRQMGAIESNTVNIEIEK